MMLGEKIQALRKERQMSQEQLANQLGVSRQSISKWELSESVPDIGNLISIGELFGVSMDTLLKEELPLQEDLAGVAAPPEHVSAYVARGEAVGAGYGVALFLAMLIVAVWCTYAGILGRTLGVILIGGTTFLALGNLVHLLIVLRWKESAKRP